MRTTKSTKKQEKMSGGHGKGKEMAETDSYIWMEN